MIQAEFPRVLTIAGSDPSGGAGIQADLRTIALLGAYGMAIPTALTVQNSLGVHAVHLLPVDLLQAQLALLMEDAPPHTIKLGMLGNTEVVNLLLDSFQAWASNNVLCKIVCDPVLVSSSGKRLLSEDALDSLIACFPYFELLTPNAIEASVLTGIEITQPEDMLKAAKALIEMGLAHVLIKGAHVEGEEVVDLLLSRTDIQSPIWLRANRVETRNDHGTGCTLSSAIATYLAKGESMVDSVTRAKQYVTESLLASQTIWNGHGHGGFMRR
ncbi:bifunctional hydroxymethylpyrimidine kinase/phosphomethylpyrimidine kinase [Leeia sp. TBRC 13508]|uniref:hydroxymethylpyrimidine kinase n=1 Tax=Leeia speluncae TaxID=2884804 RepID=A0ABS8D7S6_9NEIS|nr:bifunctional hydroxymethylpyrimidine kinase/phosphomethylpyrimidine kinase [Leeia speluncae]MCB6184237.1 bifunctional hydroxymethylpyrimidine kinase/phosphomethylpyrimidine kinase [Leeia speluncae]